MKYTSLAFIIFTIVAGVMVIGYIGNSMVKSGAVPSLSDYVASTTKSFDEYVASSTAAKYPPLVFDGEVKTPKAVISVAVAADESSRERGLSGQNFLGENQGVLFKFDEANIHGFWMKDMYLSIDIVWISESKNVIGIETNVATSTYPDIFTPPSAIKYALEVNAGSTKKMSIATGTKLAF